MSPTSEPANAPPSAREDLELEQLWLTNSKLTAEIQKLTRESEPDNWWVSLGKKAVAIGGIVTIIGTLAGLGYSYYKTITDRAQARAADERIRFEKAITRLEGKTTLSKLVGLSAIGSYAISPDATVRRQTLFTLASLVATETDRQAQAAVIDLIKGLPNKGVVAAGDWEYLQGLLVSQSRALTAKAGLITQRQFTDSDPVSPEEQAARTLGALIASNAQRGLVPGHADYAGIYCAHCNFDGVAFPDGANFSNAVLDHASFDNATLKRAHFDNAELGWTTFVQANLRGAWLRSINSAVVKTPADDGSPVARGRTAYLDHLASALTRHAQMRLRMPNFSCADLTDTHFAGHALFPAPVAVEREYSAALAKRPADVPLWYKDLPDYVLERNTTQPQPFFALLFTAPKFYKATLIRADLRDIRFFGLVEVEIPEFFVHYSEEKVAELRFAQGDIDSSVFDPKNESKSELADSSPKAQRRHLMLTRSFQARLRGAFFSSDWSSAMLPDSISNYLKVSSPTEADYRRTFPVSDVDPDLACVPRR